MLGPEAISQLRAQERGARGQAFAASGAALGAGRDWLLGPAAQAPGALETPASFCVAARTNLPSLAAASPSCSFVGGASGLIRLSSIAHPTPRAFGEGVVTRRPLIRLRQTSSDYRQFRV